MRPGKFIVGLMCVFVFGITCQGQIRIIPRETLDSLSQRRKVSSQEGIRFDSLEINFGKVREDASSVVRTFRFTNTGKDTFHISGITTSCSCVTAIPLQQDILPGRSCEIKVTYNQKGHPGRHDRYVYLYTSNGKAQTLAATLMLTGEVLASDREIEGYPVEMGYFRLDRSEIQFTVGKSQILEITAVNVSESSRKLSIQAGLIPECVRVTIADSDVLPKAKTTIKVEYDATKPIQHSSLKVPVFIDGTGLKHFNSKIEIIFR